MDAFEELYEEISSHWHKISRACEHKDHMAALVAATSLQAALNDVERHLGYDVTDFHFIHAYHPAVLDGLLAAAQRAETAFLALLAEANVPVVRYNSVAELRMGLVGLG